ncbi:hypothetical protein KP509_17G020800 [Ceratopteris richardii]|uniref:Uncharacterized protein n=1 Tax=Ceratopteris richardii TaxID=49495 RepID=A0A8T2SU84_CERRI|nr:hypothetical protein KP509_17G020800 [Ceratopteris richardii]
MDMCAIHTSFLRMTHTEIHHIVIWKGSLKGPGDPQAHKADHLSNALPLLRACFCFYHESHACPCLSLSFLFTSLFWLEEELVKETKRADSSMKRRERIKQRVRDRNGR